MGQNSNLKRPHSPQLTSDFFELHKLPGKTEIPVLDNPDFRAFRV